MSAYFLTVETVICLGVAWTNISPMMVSGRQTDRTTSNNIILCEKQFLNLLCQGIWIEKITWSYVLDKVTPLQFSSGKGASKAVSSKSTYRTRYLKGNDFNTPQTSETKTSGMENVMEVEKKIKIYEVKKKLEIEWNFVYECGANLPDQRRPKHIHCLLKKRVENTQYAELTLVLGASGFHVLQVPHAAQFPKNKLWKWVKHNKNADKRPLNTVFLNELNLLVELYFVFFCFKHRLTIRRGCMTLGVNWTWALSGPTSRGAQSSPESCIYITLGDWRYCCAILDHEMELLYATALHCFNSNEY